MFPLPPNTLLRLTGALTIVFASGCVVAPPVTGNAPAETQAIDAAPVEQAGPIDPPPVLSDEPHASVAEAVVAQPAATTTVPSQSAPRKPAPPKAVALEPSAPVVHKATPVQPAPHAAAEAVPRKEAPVVAAERPVVPRKEAPVVAAERPAAALDLATLEKRVRNTGAIGVMSKIALKNQIDDLVARFRKAHESGGGPSLAVLRQPYENLFGKVQTLLERDPALAGEISASRESIWRILTDPAKFKQLS